MMVIHCNRFSIHLIFCFLLFSVSANAQEVLLDTGTGHRVEKIKKRPVPEKPDTLALPFIDDFARDVGYPYPGLWMDDQAYINHQYPVNPPSIGAATLDALDASGKVYTGGKASGFPADTLTSKPIDLALDPADSVYLSFYYQSGGKGDTSGGEFQDSLILQYYAPDSAQWTTIWRVSYSEEDTLYAQNYISGKSRKIFTDSLGHRKFYQAILPVSDTQHLQKGFQFRFNNHASYESTGQAPGRAGNIDHWHIDFIRLDKNRSFRDTTLNDIAFVEPMKSLLINYESVPWAHFPDANAYEMDNNISITYRNLGDQVWNISREFDIIDRMWGTETFSFTGGTGDDIPPYTKETYPRRIDYIFPYNGRDSAFFEIKAYMVTDTSRERAPYRWNDTIQYFQKFYNYYAYDDGTAENGYGISGEGSERSMVAFRFRTYTPDSLQAIQIYFNQTFDEASRNNFTLMVWADDNGKPGRVIYEQDETIEYPDSVNEFQNYVLKEKPLLDDYFFIGYQKYTTEMLNVGFDVNNVNNDKLFYNKSGVWNASGLKGTIMIRPVFGKYLKPVHVAEKPDDLNQQSVDFTVYPNPVSEQMHIQLDQGQHQDYSYAIMDIQGRILARGNRLKHTMDMNNFVPGIYLIRLKHRDNHSIQINKFVISR